jgi:hypothetical protein
VNLVDTDLGRDALCGALIVAGYECESKTRLLERRDRLCRLGPDAVAKGEKAEGISIVPVLVFQLLVLLMRLEPRSSAGRRLQSMRKSVAFFNWSTAETKPAPR